MEDSEKIGYVPSNYVKVHMSGEVPKEGEGSLQTGGAAGAAATSVQEMEEVAIALHDLDRKDPKVLVLKRDERYLILDKNVGGGWWRCQNLNNGDIALAPSNFMKTEMVPKRQPPALPAPRGSVPNQSTVFVEGTYDFTAKKSSQLSYKKYDSLVITKKSGSWWTARNKMGKEGVIPYNYVKEVFPDRFIAVHPFQARSAEETTLKVDDQVSVLDMEQPGWWQIEGPQGKGFVPAVYLHPLSTRAPGAISAPATPRTAAAGTPEVPPTPRNPDGTVRVDPAAKLVGSDEPIQVEQGVTSTMTHARSYSGTVSSSPLAGAREEVNFVAPVTSNQAAIIVPQKDDEVSATPRPDFHYEPLTGRPQPVPPKAIGHGTGLQHIEPEVAPERPAAASFLAVPSAAAAAKNVTTSTPAAVPAPVQAPIAAPKPVVKEVEPTPAPTASSKLTGFFDSILPSAIKKVEPVPVAAPVITPVVASVQQEQPPVAQHTTPAKPARQEESFSGFSPQPVVQQVEGRPNQSAATARGASSAPVYGFYEGEADDRPEGDNAVLPTKDPYRHEESKEQDNSTSSNTTQIPIGSRNDPRVRQTDESMNRGACGTGGFSNFFGLFALCTGANREAPNIPRATNEEHKETNSTS